MTGAADPRCPECDEPIGQTATYCMHCSADLTDEQSAADADGDESWDSTEPTSTPGDAAGGATASEDGTTDQLLDPDGIVDNTFTVVVGIAGGVVIGVVGTVVLGLLTGSGMALLLGLVAWVGATAYLVRRRTVQEAVSKTSYGIAVVLLAVPLVALSPFATVEGGLVERGGLLVALAVAVVIPAGIATLIGWVASRFVPDGASGSEG